MFPFEVIHYAYLLQVKDNLVGNECLKEFLTNYVFENNVELSQFSEFYILVSSFGVEDTDIVWDEKSWYQLLNKEQCAKMHQNKYYVLGVMWIDKDVADCFQAKYVYEGVSTKIVRYLDSRAEDKIFHCYILNYMINKYNEKLGRRIDTLIPETITERTREFWEDYFNTQNINYKEHEILIKSQKSSPEKFEEMILQNYENKSVD